LSDVGWGADAKRDLFAAKMQSSGRVSESLFDFVDETLQVRCVF
jgi:hypothetical protein